MITIATIGPEGSHSWQAARQYSPAAGIKLFPNIGAVFTAFTNQEASHAMFPVYNTREGEIKEYFRMMETLSNGYWIDNIILPLQLSLGSLDDQNELKVIHGKSTMLRQCEEYTSSQFPSVSITVSPDLDKTFEEIKENNLSDHGVIDSEDVLKSKGFIIRAREVAPHNRTRFAVLGPEMHRTSGYDATAIITSPLKDRVGLLFDILGEFSRRGINLIDMRTKNDIQSQKLQFYLEIEGHIQDKHVQEALKCIENNVIQETGVFKVLGSYPRVDMRAKSIQNVGFVGTGDMSEWFAQRLDNEGYSTVLTGRSTSLSPEKMIDDVDVVVICVPISATSDAIQKYGPKLKKGQALILLAGEAENILNTAMQYTDEGVELMLVHNLWGPQAETMKDKNVSVVRTSRSGALCSEFESFLYKHGADISQDTPNRHDLLMGVGQKLPTIISMALAMTISENNISPDDIGSHSTLTSLYGILAMSRVHSQNPRTYAEIAATKGDGSKLVKNFAENIQKVIELAESGKIEELCAVIEKNKDHLTDDFLKARMQEALEVDKTLGAGNFSLSSK